MKKEVQDYSLEQTTDPCFFPPKNVVHWANPYGGLQEMAKGAHTPRCLCSGCAATEEIEANGSLRLPTKKEASNE